MKGTEDKGAVGLGEQRKIKKQQQEQQRKIRISLCFAFALIFFVFGRQTTNKCKIYGFAV